MQPETTSHVGRSSGPTPNNMAAKNREIANAPDQPAAIPQMAGISPYRSIKPVTRAGEAPNRLATRQGLLPRTPGSGPPADSLDNTVILSPT